MLKFRIRLAFAVVASFLTMHNLCAQTADSLFVSGITNGTSQDTLINTLGVVSDSTMRDSLALSDTVRADSVQPKAVRDTSKYGLYRRVFIE